MKQLEYTTTDKKSWPRGEWDNEPDKIQFKDEATGLPCLIVRNGGGALCGYVGVTKNHPAFGKDYEELDYDVHGGLTFTDRCQPGAEDHAICHLVEDGEDDNVWWLGFDCAHSQDCSPAFDLHRNGGMAALGIGLYGTYKNVDYVKAQIKQLADQVAADSP